MKIISIIFCLLFIFNIFGTSAFSLTDSPNDTFMMLINENYDMVIISPEKFSSEIQPLIIHKNNHDLHTFIKTTEEIYKEYEGKDKSEQIKYFIKDAIEKNDIKYVLLVGGRIKQSFKWYIPPRYSNLDDEFIDKKFLSDLYFADIYKDNGDFEDWDGNNNGVFAEWGVLSGDKIDLIPDVSLGRLPCRSKEEVKDVIEKIIEYENKAYGKEWLKRILLIGGDTNPGIGEPFPNEGEVACDWLIRYLEGYTATKLYTSDRTLTGPDDFITAFNNGYGFVCYHGHGLTDSMVTYYPDSTDPIFWFHDKDISKLKNAGMYPVMIVGCCLTTSFDVGIFDFLRILKNRDRFHNYNLLSFSYRYVSDCIGWNMVKKPQGGSIAHIGSSSTAYGYTGDTNNDNIPDSVQKGMTSGLCNEFFRIFGEEDKKILGEIYREALTNIINNNSVSTNKIQCKCIQEFQLIGDPSLKIGGYQ